MLAPRGKGESRVGATNTRGNLGLRAQILPLWVKVSRTRRMVPENQPLEGGMDPGFLCGFPCSLQPRQIRGSSRIWGSVLYQAFGPSSPPSPAPLLLSLLLPPIWCRFPHLSCVSLLSSLLHPLLHLHLNSLIPQCPPQLFRLRTSPHCVQIH